jgi:hypothetical protein
MSCGLVHFPHGSALARWLQAQLEAPGTEWQRKIDEDIRHA